MKLNINKGDRFGKLVIIKEDGKFYQPSGQSQRAFLCKCDCGKEKRIRLSHLTSGRVKSCNCDAHGESGTRLYNTWRGIKNRTSPYHSESHLYYDKGVTMYQPWIKYNVFKDWALNNGYEEGLTIDRIDGNGNYEPNNCRFVPQYINCANRECTYYVEYNNKTIAFTILVREMGLTDNESAIRSRIKRGWSVEDAFDKPIRKGNYYRKRYSHEQKERTL